MTKLKTCWTTVSLTKIEFPQDCICAAWMNTTMGATNFTNLNLSNNTNLACVIHTKEMIVDSHLTTNMGLARVTSMFITKLCRTGASHLTTRWGKTRVEFGAEIHPSKWSSFIASDPISLCFEISCATRRWNISSEPLSQK
jgi:hypothetical protein